MVETVVSIVQSSPGGVVQTAVKVMSEAEALAYDTAKWVARLKELREFGSTRYLASLAAEYGSKPAFEAAVTQLAAHEARVAALAAADAAAVAAEGTLVAGAGTTVAAIVVPVVGLAAVGLALGAGYYEAREDAKKEGFASGFSKGFITGLLKWSLKHTIDRFWDNALSRNNFDEQLPTIYANSHNNGLLKGRMGGLTINDKMKKQYLKALRKLSGASSDGWEARSSNWMEEARARRVQTTYVIEMAAAAVKHGVLSQAN